MSSIKKVTAKVAEKKATPETWRRTWRTMLQVFLSIFLAGIPPLIMDWGSPEFKLGLFALLATAIGGALGHVMNLEDVAPGDDPEVEP